MSSKEVRPYAVLSPENLEVFTVKTTQGLTSHNTLDSYLIPLNSDRKFSMHSHWQKQGSEPLFPDLVWARPETRASAGKLLIVGGTAQSFASSAEAYVAAEKAGVGTCRIVLPNSLTKTVAKLFPEALFAPSTPSGSFAVSALAELLDHAAWADGVLIAADTGNNSETAQLFENFLSKGLGGMPSRAIRHTAERNLPIFAEDFSTAPDEFSRNENKASAFSATLCGDLIDCFMSSPTILLDRPQTTLILGFDQLQKLATAAHFYEAFTSGMGILRFVEKLHDFNKLHAAHLVVIYQDTVAIAVDGHISTTNLGRARNLTQIAASAATWWLQNPTKPYEALTTAVH